MTLNQRVPTTAFGGMAQWSKAVADAHYVTAGADFRRVDADSNEESLDTVSGATVTTRRSAGGTQRSVGVFLQDMMTPTPKLTLTLSARVDHWRNYEAHFLEVSAITGLPTPNNRLLPDKEDTVASPRVAALYRLTDRVHVWGDVGWGFRAPTLNELYRQFQVGQVRTLANDQLGPERLVGGEAGISVQPLPDLTVRSTWFDNRVKNPVSNVTIGTNLQQRQNLGRTRIWGLQTDVEYLLGSSWRFSGGYLYDQAKVRENHMSIRRLSASSWHKFQTTADRSRSPTRTRAI
jgi:outer membrane receptor protein involved in Fe transport